MRFSGLIRVARSNQQRNINCLKALNLLYGLSFDQPASSRPRPILDYHVPNKSKLRVDSSLYIQSLLYD